MTRRARWLSLLVELALGGGLALVKLAYVTSSVAPFCGVNLHGVLVQCEAFSGLLIEHFII